VPTLIEKLHLLDGDYLKRAAALLFDPDPERFFTGAFVKIGYFRTNADLLYHDEIHGDLFTQVEKTMDLLLTKYLRAGISYRGIQRVETFPVPEAALREALLNAIIHKDYSWGDADPDQRVSGQVDALERRRASAGLDRGQVEGKALLAPVQPGRRQRVFPRRYDRGLGARNRADLPSLSRGARA
jgi:hypothetical protein